MQHIATACGIAGAITALFILGGLYQRAGRQSFRTMLNKQTGAANRIRVRK